MDSKTLPNIIFILLAAIISTLTPSTHSSAETFSIVVLPDTQWYSEIRPDIFEAQTQWIVDNIVTRKIIYTAHLGDLKDNQGCEDNVVGPGERTEWDVVRGAMSTLETPIPSTQAMRDAGFPEGFPDGIPYGVTPGNHDFDQVNGQCPSYNETVETDSEHPGRPLNSFNEAFETSPSITKPYSERVYFGDSYDADDIENNYTLFEFSGVKFIAINLAYHQVRPPWAPAPGSDPDSLVPGSV